MTSKTYYRYPVKTYWSRWHVPKNGTHEKLAWHGEEFGAKCGHVIYGQYAMSAISPKPEARRHLPALRAGAETLTKGECDGVQD